MIITFYLFKINLFLTINMFIIIIIIIAVIIKLLLLLNHVQIIIIKYINTIDWEKTIDSYYDYVENLTRK